MVPRLQRASVGRLGHFIGQALVDQHDLDAAVLLASFRRVVRGHRIIFAPAGCHHALGRHADVLQKAHHGGRARDDQVTVFKSVGFALEDLLPVGLGYAPKGDEFGAAMRQLGFKDERLLEAGLLAQRDDGSLRPRFWGRLLFPIHDLRGRVVGFGGRVLGPGEPKYLNSPDTPLFHKGQVLYGLAQAREAARKSGRIVGGEGYMDVIAAHQFGVTNVVASNGTAITEKQMTLLKRYTENVVLALDADNAGSEATLRGVQVAAGAADHMAVPTIDWRGLVSVQDVLRADIRVVSLPDAGHFTA